MYVTGVTTVNEVRSDRITRLLDVRCIEILTERDLGSLTLFDCTVIQKDLDLSTSGLPVVLHDWEARRRCPFDRLVLSSQDLRDALEILHGTADLR